MADEGAGTSELAVADEMALGENRYTRARLSRRVLGWRRFAAWLLAAVVALTAVACVLANRLLPVSGDLRALFSLLAFLAAASFEVEAYRRWSRRAQVAVWTARGRAEPESVRFSIGDDGFHADYGATSTRVGWPAVSEIIPTPRHWLFIGGTLAYSVPRRFFEDSAAERAFLRAALDRLTAEARARSPEAVAFAAE